MSIINDYAYDYRDIKMPEEPLATMLRSFAKDLLAEIVPEKSSGDDYRLFSWDMAIDQINKNLDEVLK